MMIFSLLAICLMIVGTHGHLRMQSAVNILRSEVRMPNDTGKSSSDQTLDKHKKPRFSPYSTNPSEPNLYEKFEGLAVDFSNCRLVFIDGGSNVGVHVRSLFEPSHYLGSPYQRIFTEMFGEGAWRSRPSQETGICALGIEADPGHKGRLEHLEACYRAHGWTVKFLVPAALTANGHKIVNFLARDENPEIFGPGVIYHHEVLVESVDLTDIVRKVFTPEATKRKILVKMDIEGAEYEVVPHLDHEGLFCDGSIDMLTVEWHGGGSRDTSARRKVREKYANFTARACPKDTSTTARFAQSHTRAGHATTRIVDVGDESYRDEYPLEKLCPSAPPPSVQSTRSSSENLTRGPRLEGKIHAHDDAAFPTAVLFFAYYESPDSDFLAARNLQFFIDFSLRAGALGDQYDLIVAEARSKTHRLRSLYHDRLNQHFRWLTFENYGFDFCLWKKAMQMVKQSAYKFFAFANGSVRGPFVDCDKSKTWLSEFTKRLDPYPSPPSPAIRLVGTTINCLSNNCTRINGFQNELCNDIFVHAQSMFLVTDQIGVGLMNTTMYCTKDLGAVIGEFETGISRKFLASGWNIAVLEEYWRGHNFHDHESTRKKCTHIDRHQHQQDPYTFGNEPFELGFRNVLPHEVIMFKAKRAEVLNNTDVLESLTANMMTCNTHADRNDEVSTTPLRVLPE